MNHLHKKKKYIFLLFLMILVPTFCNSKKANNNKIKKKIKLIEAFPRRFDKPVFMEVFPARYPGLPILYAIVEQAGRIILLPQTKKISKEIVLLDKRNNICSAGSEEGLLGLAFDPFFSKTGRAYIYYSLCRPRRTVLSRLTITTIKKVKRLSDLKFNIKEEKLLSIPQPYSNHNGGMIAFHEGHLYIGVGDGGSGGDPHYYSQKLNTLLGKILRIDVSPDSGYKIPSDNPFRSQSKSANRKVRPEIFAYGLRNPWRFSFDPPSKKLIVGDVGQNRYEEINIVKKGKNYGWNIMEGTHCYKPAKNCNRKRLELPILEYSHRWGQCVIGGYIYRGSSIPWLRGKYILGDTTTGRIWYSDLKNGRMIQLLKTNHYISSFAKDEKGEIYVLDLIGKILKISPADPGRQ